MAQILRHSTREAVTNDLTTDKQNVFSPQTKSYHFEDYSAVPVCKTAVFLGTAKILLTLRRYFR
jgi:vancomycin permeability regulator SanA